VSILFPTSTVPKIILTEETETAASFAHGEKGEKGDTGLTGVTGNGTGYPTAAAVDTALNAFTARGNVLTAQVGSWVNLTLLNSWFNYGSGWQVARYRRIGDWVFLEGLIGSLTNPSNNIIATLPIGFRPAVKTLYYVHTGEPHANGRIDVDPTGSIIRQIGNYNYMSLSGIVFSTT